MSGASAGGTARIPGTYILFHEAWYAEANRRTLRDGQTGREIYVRVGAEAETLEVTIAEHVVRGWREVGLNLSVRDDGWQAFARMPELFTGLAGLGDDPKIEDVRSVLDSLGFKDVTPRERAGE